MRLGKEKTLIETDNREAYNAIRLQEHAFIEPELEEVMQQINSLHNNFFRPGSTEREITLVPLRMNRPAEYLAQYGMNHLTDFDMISGMFGNLQDLLDRDLGLGRPFSDRDMQENFGLGEVLDSPPHGRDL